MARPYSQRQEVMIYETWLGTEGLYLKTWLGSIFSQTHPYSYNMNFSFLWLIYRLAPRFRCTAPVHHQSMPVFRRRGRRATRVSYRCEHSYDMYLNIDNSNHSREEEQ